MADDELRSMIDEFDHDGDGESLYCMWQLCHSITTTLSTFYK